MKANQGLPMEIWHARDGIKSYPTMTEFLKAVAEFKATGAKLNATYVYDKETGLKLFGKTAFYVKAATASLPPSCASVEAEAYAEKVGGAVVTYEQAWELGVLRPDARRTRRRGGRSTGSCGEATVSTCAGNGP